MKKIIKILLLTVFYIQVTVANSVSIINSTSGQSSITIKTDKNSTTQSASPNINQFLNSTNNPEPTPTIISYDNSPIQKIVITRLSTNMPQVIYVRQNTADSNQHPGGIYNINLTGNGSMKIWTDHVDINNISYVLTDLSSYINKCNNLRNTLTPTNMDSIQEQSDDVASSIKLVHESDMASQLASQISIIESGISVITHNIKIMKTFNSNLQTVQNLEESLSTDNVDSTQQTLQVLQSGLQTLSQSDLSGSLYKQSKALQNAMDKLQADIQQVQINQQAVSAKTSVS